ncbi:MAG: hypothetical protein PVI57_06100 [Gemmatimonadota bacterium]|jgi:hypothetical protein
MDAPARCITCREPLDEQGRCPECESKKPHDALALEERLRRLREEVARERGSEAPAEPRSALWRRKKAQLEKAKKEAERQTARKAKEEARKEAKEEEAAAGGKANGGTARTGTAKDVGEAASTEAEGDSGKEVERGTKPAAQEEEAREVPRPEPRVYRSGVSESGIRARELDVTDPRHGSEAVAELIEHRRKGLGKILGLAGLPRHGKTKLADRLRERYAERPGADLRYDKTERGEVNIYYIPGRREHHVLVDVAGEDFQALGDYERDLPALMRRFLWPVLQELDGLFLLMALPIVWAGWNPEPGQGDRRAEPSERDEIGMREATQRMLDAHRMLLKYAMVARDLKRIRKAMPQLGLSAEEAPTRNQVDDAFQTAGRLEIPVAIGFSKADLYAPGGSRSGEGRGDDRSGLYTPDLPGGGGRAAPPLHPLYTDPLVLGHLHFPELFDFLEERVRFFKFDFVQALVDRSESPDPQEATADATDASRETLLGAEGLVEFLTRHPWRVPGIGTATAIALDRRLRPDRWDRSLLRRLHDRRPGEGR